MKKYLLPILLISFWNCAAIKESSQRRSDRANFGESLGNYDSIEDLNNGITSEMRQSIEAEKNKMISQLPPPSDNPSFIAVIDFKGNNISEGECRALTDRLRAELFNTKHYKVIEREMMEEIIKEQGFQQSGCSTDECMVEVGKLIGVEKIVGGSISKVGRTYSVSSRIVSVETGKILKGATYDYKGEIDELLTTGMKMVAYELIK